MKWFHEKIAGLADSGASNPRQFLLRAYLRLVARFRQLMKEILEDGRGKPTTKKP